MKIYEMREIINIIKNEPFSILIIFSLLILPVIFLEWVHFFPESWKVWIILLIIASWFVALHRLRNEILIYRRKIILLNYLKKDKRHSFDHLSKEWAGKKEFTEENIHELLMTYPDVFKYVKIKRKSNRKDLDGVGLVECSDEKNK